MSKDKKIGKILKQKKIISKLSLCVLLIVIWNYKDKNQKL